MIISIGINKKCTWAGILDRYKTFYSDCITHQYVHRPIYRDITYTGKMYLHGSLSLGWRTLRASISSPPSQCAVTRTSLLLLHLLLYYYYNHYTTIYLTKCPSRVAPTDHTKQSIDPLRVFTDLIVSHSRSTDPSYIYSI